MSADPEELLRRLALGEITREDPEVVRRMNDDPSFRAEVEECVSVLGALDQAGVEQREGIEQSLARDSAPGAEWVDRLVRRETLQGGGASLPRLRRRRPLWGLLAAAAAIVLAVVFFRSEPDPGRSDDEPSTPQTLGPEVASQAEVIRSEGTLSGLRWSGVRGPDAVWIVELLDGNLRPVEGLVPHQSESEEWILTEAERSLAGTARYARIRLVEGDSDQGPPLLLSLSSSD